MCIYTKSVTTRGKEWVNLEPNIFTLFMESIECCCIILYFTLSLEAIISRKERGSVFPISQTPMKQQSSTSYGVGFFYDVNASGKSDAYRLAFT